MITMVAETKYHTKDKYPFKLMCDLQLELSDMPPLIYLVVNIVDAVGNPDIVEIVNTPTKDREHAKKLIKNHYHAVGVANSLGLSMNDTSLILDIYELLIDQCYDELAALDITRRV